MSARRRKFSLTRASLKAAVCASGLAPLAIAFLLRSQSAPFTYQGQLWDAGQRASGSYDLRFTLWNAGVQGEPVSSSLTNAATAVSNGVFTVTLDFGSRAFDGSSLWLEIGVRTNGNPRSYTVLSPRQALTATPYAICAGISERALQADQLTGGASLAGNGAGVTNISGAAIAAGTITSVQLDAQTWFQATNRSGLAPVGSVSNLMRVFNVNDYGASPSHADNSGPISAALAAMNSAGGGVLYFPERGTYNDRTNHVLTTPIVIQGSGTGEATFWGCVWRDARVGNTGAPFIDGWAHLTLRDISVVGQGLALAGSNKWATNYVGIYMHNCTSLVASRLYVSDFGIGLAFAEASLLHSEVEVERCVKGVVFGTQCDGVADCFFRVNRCDIGLEVGGVLPEIQDGCQSYWHYGHPPIPGSHFGRNYVFGDYDGIVVLFGGSGSVGTISGYAESPGRALIQIGHDPAAFPEYFNTPDGSESDDWSDVTVDQYAWQDAPGTAPIYIPIYVSGDYRITANSGGAANASQTFVRSMNATADMMKLDYSNPLVGMGGGTNFSTSTGGVISATRFEYNTSPAYYPGSGVAGAITNNAMVWLALNTNAAPTLDMPNGSLCTTASGQLFVRSNHLWVAH